MASVTSNEEFARRMVLLARPAERFRPTATYDPDGDCIEFLAKPDPFYADRVDELVTVYYSQETGEVIGSCIKGLAAFCRDMLQKMPGFRIVIEDGPIKLEHIFLARLLSLSGNQETLATLTYQKLIQVSHDIEVEGELCLV